MSLAPLAINIALSVSATPVPVTTKKTALPAVLAALMLSEAPLLTYDEVVFVSDIGEGTTSAVSITFGLVMVSTATDPDGLLQDAIITVESSDNAIVWIGFIRMGFEIINEG